MRGKPTLIQLRDKAGNLLSPYWYIRYYQGRGRRISTGCFIGSQDHEANLALAAFTLERERPLAREPDKLMIAQALRDYYEEHAKHLVSAANAKRSEVKLNEFFGGRFVAQITPALVNQYVRQWKERGQSNGSIRRDLQILGCALNHEVREQRLTYAPKFKLPPEPPARSRFLSEEEKERLLAACTHERTKNFIAIMLNTGQRPSAVETLTWFQVDFDERVIHFERTGKEQSNKRVRPIAMNHELYTLLKSLFEKKENSYVLGHPGSTRTAFRNACKEAGLEKVSRYTLRHTVLDRVNEVADEKTASDIGGHTNSLTTRKHYIKSKMDRQREVLDGLWGG